MKHKEFWTAKQYGWPYATTPMINEIVELLNNRELQCNLLETKLADAVAWLLKRPIEVPLVS